MRAVLHPRLSAQLMRYLGVGLANMAVGLSTIYLCMYVLHADDVSANVTGYCAGVACSFVLNRRWTFASRNAWFPELLRFLLVLSIAYTANLATVLAATRLLGVNRYFAQALGMFPYTAIGYAGSRAFAFRRPSVVATSLPCK